MNDTESQVLAELNKIKSDLNQWGMIVDKIITETLGSLSDLNKVKIKFKFRLKSDDSYVTKALYRNKPYLNPIHDIEDKVGTRVVLTNTNDVYDAYELLKSVDVWELKTTKNIKELIEEKPNQFDYQSIHIIVYPKDEYGDFNTDRKLLTCEIQIRTLLQHAYAEVCHDTTYKGLYRNDKMIIRHLAKSMALMESVDDYFCDIFEMMDDEKRAVRIYIKELIRLFQSIKPDFTEQQLDFEMSETIMDLIDIDAISIEKIENMIHRDTDYIECIKHVDNILFNQPIILIITYLFINRRSFINEEWPFSSKALEDLYFYFGVSYD